MLMRKAEKLGIKEAGEVSNSHRWHFSRFFGKLGSSGSYSVGAEDDRRLHQSEHHPLFMEKAKKASGQAGKGSNIVAIGLVGAGPDLRLVNLPGGFKKFGGSDEGRHPVGAQMKMPSCEMPPAELLNDLVSS